MKASRWLIFVLVAMSLVLVADLGMRALEDRRIRLHTLVTLDPPPAPAIVHRDRLTLSVTGALVRPAGPSGPVLRAWSPTPAIRVLDPGGGEELTLRVDNLPLRATLKASGPVAEERAGPTRILRFDPHATLRIGFVAPADAATFAVLGDTGDSETFAEALRLAARQGADFLLHAGDLIYEDAQVPNIERLLATSPVPVLAIRGNHDYRNQTRIDFMRALAPPYYVFTWGGARFLILDDAGDYLPGFWRRSTQYRWWRDVLGGPRGGPLFVAMHKPPFDRRSQDVGAAIYDRPLARQLMQDFEQAGVEAVFTGHVHATYLWMQDGIPYVINGEGEDAPSGVRRNRMAWVQVRGWHVSIEQIPIWGP